jgi:hypothetical protein
MRYELSTEEAERFELLLAREVKSLARIVRSRNELCKPSWPKSAPSGRHTPSAIDRPMGHTLGLSGNTKPSGEVGTSIWNGRASRLD